MFKAYFLNPILKIETVEESLENQCGAGGRMQTLGCATCAGVKALAVAVED